MKKYIFLSLIILAAWACTKTIEFDDNGVGNLIVLNSIISPDSCISGDISQSTSILKGNRTGGFIDGTVELYENGNKVGQMNPLFGKFRFPEIKPISGNTYRIVVISGGKQAEAETTIPEKVDLISVDTVSVSNEWGGRFLSCKLKIRDSSGEDFYRLVLLDESLNMSFNKDDSVKRRYYLYKSLYSVNSDDPVFKSVYNNFGSDVIDMGPDNQYSIFPDDYFQGKEYSLQIPTLSFNNNYYDPANPNLDYYTKQIYLRRTILIQKLSKGYYNYMKYLNLYNFYHDDPFAEPVPVYSNIENGAGIFGSFNNDTKFAVEKIYFPYSMDTIKVEEQQNGYGGGYYNYY